MGKSRAEVQKAYRERKKAELGNQYLQLESRQVMKYYEAADTLSMSKKKKRNALNKKRNQESRSKKKLCLQALTMSDTSDVVDKSVESANVPDTSDVGNPQRLLVKLNSVQLATKANGPRKARARALARANKNVKALQEQTVSLKRKLNTRNKQIERLHKKIKTSRTEAVADNKSLTPRRRTDQEVESLNLTPVRKERVRRKLLTSNVLLHEISNTKQSSTQKQRSVIHKVIAGKIVRKYRCVTQIGCYTGLCKKALMRSGDKCLKVHIEKRRRTSQHLSKKVEEFMGREDNCRMQPGKADAKKMADGGKKQTRVLTDYMRNIHQKFKAEHPELKISLATFCRLRPKYILLAKFISRNACQCLKHQNMALKVQAIRKLGIAMSENPENILLTKDDIYEKVKNFEVDNVTHRVWKRVELPNKVKKMKIVECEISRDEFANLLTTETNEFCDHVARVRAQYHELKANKDTLKQHDFIVQMDFAENFSCRSLDEVQTAYWNQTSVTLHPVVIYYRNPADQQLKHKSYVIISDEMAHSSSTVLTFIDHIIPELKKIDTKLNTVHYWTDSPSSQYRNRYIFNLIMKHAERYSCRAVWNYFECGHGKSACDGIGGTVKRMADGAIRQGNAVIQDAVEFYKWAEQSSMKEITSIFVPKEQCQKKQEELLNMNIKAVKNTMKLHAVRETNDGEQHLICIRMTSCYCAVCVSGTVCGTWDTQPMIEQKPAEKERRTGLTIMAESEDLSIFDKSIAEENVNTESVMVSTENVFSSLSENEFVATIYEGSWYIGQIVEIDVEDKDCKIEFMEKSKAHYKWPKQKDSLWVKEGDILCKITPPMPKGNSGRMYILAAEDAAKIECLFN